jgi:hypothetical protein
VFRLKKRGRSIVVFYLVGKTDEIKVHIAESI